MKRVERRSHIAVHGTDPDFAYKIQQLEPEKEFKMSDIDEMTAKEKEMYETPDQWKGYGMCEKCRRQKYCKTTCSAHRSLMISWIKKKLFAELAEMFEKETQA